MTTFDRREEAFEAMFVHDEEMHFRAEARRAKMLADWVTSLRGHAASDTSTYSDELVQFVVAHPGDAALFERIRGDLNGAATDAQIRERLSTTMAEATRQVKSA